MLFIGQRFRLPSIVSFLVIGMLVGPFGFALITDQSLIDTIGEIGIVLLLFTIGLEFSFQTFSDRGVQSLSGVSCRSARRLSLSRLSPVFPDAF